MTADGGENFVLTLPEATNGAASEANGQSVFRGGSNAIIVASPALGYELSHWLINGTAATGPERDANPLVVTLDAPTAVSPQFLQMQAPGSSPPAVLTSAGVVNAAGFQTGPVSAAEIVSLFGENLASGPFFGTESPLPTTLGGVTVELADATGTTRMLRLFFVGPNQINAEVPPESSLGLATLRVRREDGGMAEVEIEVVAAAPGLFSANASGRGVAAAAAVRVDASGVQTPLQVLSSGVPVMGHPIELGSDTVVLLLFGTGLRNFQQGVEVTIGGVRAQVVGVAAQPDFVGLDQVNVIIPMSLAGAGEVEVVVTVDGNVANTVTIVIG